WAPSSWWTPGPPRWRPWWCPSRSSTRRRTNPSRTSVPSSAQAAGPSPPGPPLRPPAEPALQQPRSPEDPTMRTRPTTHHRPDTRQPVGLPGPPRFEVLPLPGIAEEVPEHLPAHATVTVTASPRQGMSATIDCAVALAL